MRFPRAPVPVRGRRHQAGPRGDPQPARAAEALLGDGRWAGDAEEAGAAYLCKSWTSFHVIFFKKNLMRLTTSAAVAFAAAGGAIYFHITTFANAAGVK